MAGAATYTIKLDQFEGPFDLLLFFIERDELDIYDIPIATIADEFLAYIHEMGELDIEVASEFILVAATLMRIKSKTLLPRKDFDAEGNWVETERSIKYGDLPEAVKKTIEEQYDKDDVEEVELVEHPTKGTFYDVELKRDGKKFDVEVAANGRVIGIEE